MKKETEAEYCYKDEKYLTSYSNHKQRLVASFQYVEGIAERKKEQLAYARKPVKAKVKNLLEWGHVVWAHHKKLR